MATAELLVKIKPLIESGAFDNEIKQIKNSMENGIKIDDSALSGAFDEAQAAAKKFNEEQKKVLAQLNLTGKKGTAEYKQVQMAIADSEKVLKKFDDAMEDVNKKPFNLGDKLKGGLGQVGGALQSMTGLSAGMLGVGAVAGGVATAFKGLYDQQKNVATAMLDVKAKTGATDEQMKELEQSAKNAFVKGVGESIADAVTIMGTGQQMLGQFLDTKGIEQFTVRAAAIGQVFDKDVNEVISKSRTFISNFGLDGQKAADLVSYAMQKSGTGMDDTLDTLDEYSQLMKEAGFSAEEFVSILTTGVQAGTRDTDKLADAMKETQIRIKAGDYAKPFTDMIAASSGATQKLQADVKAILDSAANGDITIAEAMQKAAMKIEEGFAKGDINAQMRSQLQIAISGTPAEDLGADLYGRIFGAPIDKEAINKKAQEAGNELANALGPINSFETLQKTLEVTFFDTFKDIFPMIQQLLGVIGNSLGPVLTNLFKTLQPFIDQSLALMGDRMTIIGDVLNSVMPLFGVLLDIFMRLMVPLEELMQSLLPPLATIITLVADILAQDLLPSLMPIIDLAAELILSIVPVINIFADLLKAVSPLIRLFTALVGVIVKTLLTPIKWLASGMQELGKWVQSVSKWVKEFSESILGAVKEVLSFFGIIKDAPSVDASVKNKKEIKQVTADELAAIRGTKEWNAALRQTAGTLQGEINSGTKDLQTATAELATKFGIAQDAAKSFLKEASKKPTGGGIGGGGGAATAVKKEVEDILAAYKLLEASLSKQAELYDLQAEKVRLIQGRDKNIYDEAAALDKERANLQALNTELDNVANKYNITLDTMGKASVGFMPTGKQDNKIIAKYEKYNQELLDITEKYKIKINEAGQIEIGVPADDKTKQRIEKEFNVATKNLETLTSQYNFGKNEDNKVVMGLKMDDKQTQQVITEYEKLTKEKLQQENMVLSIEAKIKLADDEYAKKLEDIRNQELNLNVDLKVQTDDAELQKMILDYSGINEQIQNLQDSVDYQMSFETTNEDLAMVQAQKEELTKLLEDRLKIMQSIADKEKVLYEGRIAAIDEWATQEVEKSKATYDQQLSIFDKVNSMVDMNKEYFIKKQDDELAALENSKTLMLITEEAYEDQKTKIQERYGKKQELYQKSLEAARQEIVDKGAVAELEITRDKLQKQLDEAVAAGDSLKADTLSQELGKVEKNIADKSNLLLKGGIKLQEGVTKVFGNLFAGDKEAMRQNAREFFAEILGILQTQASLLVTKLVVDELTTYSFFQGGIGALLVLPVIKGVIQAAMNALLAPIVNMVTSFADGGRVDYPTLAVVGDASKRTRTDTEWITNDRDILSLINFAIEQNNKKFARFWQSREIYMSIANALEEKQQKLVEDLSLNLSLQAAQSRGIRFGSIQQMQMTDQTLSGGFSGLESKLDELISVVKSKEFATYLDSVKVSTEVNRANNRKKIYNL